ncbi:MAG: sugar ABC transporter substrate-binding protein [Lachnospiraceae bacterium]|nr:sugar ABC transporter substrate-binding protein [Lachnospiraceae bacterium]
MDLKKKLIATAAVIAMAAVTIYGSTLQMGGAEKKLSWFDKKETIYFWYSDETLSSYINSAAVSFGEREGVRVIPVLVSESEYLEAVNKASLEGKQIPDAYILSNDSLEKAYLAGLASEVGNAESIRSGEQFPPAAVSAVTYHDRIVGYPLFFETSALLYNETYLLEWARQQAQRELVGEDGEGVPDEALLKQKTGEYFESALPVTMDDVLNIADTFDAPEGVEGVMEWDVSDIFYNYWIVGKYMVVGGDAGDDDANIDICNDRTLACLEVYKALNQFFYIEADTVTYEAVIQDFIEGKTMFTIATTDVVRTLEEAKAQGRLVYDYGITTMPDVSADLESRSLSVTGVVVINGYSENKDLANDFAAYMTGEYAKQLYERTGKVPADRNANDGHDALQIFALEYADSVSLPKMMETGNYWLQLEVLFSRIWNGEDVNTQVQKLADQIGSQLNGRAQ